MVYAMLMFNCLMRELNLMNDKQFMYYSTSIQYPYVSGPYIHPSHF